MTTTHVSGIVERAPVAGAHGAPRDAGFVRKTPAGVFEAYVNRYVYGAIPYFGGMTRACLEPRFLGTFARYEDAVFQVVFWDWTDAGCPDDCAA